ncbi:MAG: 4Fe-4S binding protein, partial [Clostridia bacterium]|nr:4Fe-4S binding protein [Clostridia bacterium]
MWKRRRSTLSTNPKKIPYIDHQKCYGCKVCLFDCPVNA